MKSEKEVKIRLTEVRETIREEKEKIKSHIDGWLAFGAQLSMVPLNDLKTRESELLYILSGEKKDPGKTPKVFRCQLTNFGKKCVGRLMTLDGENDIDGECEECGWKNE